MGNLILRNPRKTNQNKKVFEVKQQEPIELDKLKQNKQRISKPGITNIFAIIHFFYQKTNIPRLYSSSNEHNQSFSVSELKVLRLTIKIVKNDHETVGLMMFMKYIKY